MGLVAQVAERGVGVGGDDEQNGVGANGAGFEDLKRVEDEVLAQAGNVDDVGRLLEVGERALKELFVGEDRQRGGAGGLEGAGQGCGIKVAADEPFGGRGFFDFGDDRGPVDGGGTKSGGKAAGGMGGGSALHAGRSPRPLCGPVPATACGQESDQAVWA